mmetsp:Transcript_58789/g.137660  ORF Transcript_58789/g.137660 Transcript_58789/m.137660 type:complete len:269 (-) Transcript_58789:404-1210(-)
MQICRNLENLNSVAHKAHMVLPVCKAGMRQGAYSQADLERLYTVLHGSPVPARISQEKLKALPGVGRDVSRSSRLQVRVLEDLICHNCLNGLVEPAIDVPCPVQLYPSLELRVDAAVKGRQPPVVHVVLHVHPEGAVGFVLGVPEHLYLLVAVSELGYLLSTSRHPDVKGPAHLLEEFELASEEVRLQNLTSQNPISMHKVAHDEAVRVTGKAPQSCYSSWGVEALDLDPCSFHQCLELRHQEEKSLSLVWISRAIGEVEHNLHWAVY